jgi:hypothetical protein
MYLLCYKCEIWVNFGLDKKGGFILYAIADEYSEDTQYPMWQNLI